MQAPLTIRFATDHSAAKSGMQDLAASVLSNMVKVSDALNTGIQANGGYAASARMVATNVGRDVASVAQAGIKAANDSGVSVIATTAAMTQAAAGTKTASAVMMGAQAAAAAQARTAYAIIRNEAEATGKLIASSPLADTKQAQAVKSLVANVLSADFALMSAAGRKAAAETDASAKTIGTAVGQAAGQTQTLTALKAGAAATVTQITSSPALGSVVTGLATLAVSYLIVKAAVGQANEQLERLIKLGAESEAAGVGVEFWQRFVDGAKSAKVAVADVEAALKHASTTVTPKIDEKDPVEKRLSEVFESGYTGDYQSKGLASYRAATSNDGRIRATITAMLEMKALGIELASMDVAEKMFGADFTNKIRAGQVAIENIAEGLDRKRDDLIKQEEVDRAQEYSERLDEAKKAIDEALHVSTALAGAGQAVLDVWLKIVEAIASASKVAGTLMDKMLAAAKAAKDAQPSSALQSPLATRVPGEGEGNLAADLGAVAGRGARGRTLYPEPIGPQQPTMTISDPPAPPRRPIDMYVNPEKYGIGVKPAGKKSGGSESFDAVETFINGLEKTAAAVKAETEAFGKSNAEKAAAINLAKLKETADQQGIAVTDAQTEKVRAASVATAEYRDKLQDLEQAQAQAAETARYFGNALSSGLADAILEGKSLGNVLMDLEKQIARSALQAIFTGQGPLAGFLGMAPAASSGGNSVGGLAGMLGSLFGSGSSAANAPLAGAQGPTMESGGIGSLFSGLFRANGGPVRAGQAYTVGEIGQEIFVPGQDGTIVPAGRGAGAAGGAPVLNFIDQRPAGSGDLAPTTRRNPDGSTDILIRQLDAGLQARGQRGQGGLSSALNTPGTRRG